MREETKRFPRGAASPGTGPGEAVARDFSGRGAGTGAGQPAGLCNAPGDMVPRPCAVCNLHGLFCGKGGFFGGNEKCHLGACFLAESKVC